MPKQVDRDPALALLRAFAHVPMAGFVSIKMCLDLLLALEDAGWELRRQATADVLRERLMNFGGFQRGSFWVDRDDVLRLINEVYGEEP